MAGTRGGTASQFRTVYGQTLEVGGRIYPNYATPVPIVPAQPLYSPPPPAPSREAVTTQKRRRTDIRLVIIGVVVIVILALVGLASAYHSFSFIITESSELIEYAGSHNQSFPTGVTISGSWSTPTGVSVTIQIEAPGGSTVFLGEGTSGSFSFTTSYSGYSFVTDSNSNTSVSVDGGYWAL